MNYVKLPNLVERPLDYEILSILRWNCNMDPVQALGSKFQDEISKKPSVVERPLDCEILSILSWISDLDSV